MAATDAGLRPRATASAMIRSVYAIAAALASTRAAHSPSTPSTGAGSVPTVAPRTCPMWAAGSVVTSSVRWPARAVQTAVAHEATVLPTPPLPAKKTVRGPPFGNRAFLTAASSSTAVRADRDSAWPKAGRAACSSASSGTRARSRAIPRTSPSRSGTRRVGIGSCRAISARYRSCIAIREAKKGVEPSSAGRMPLTMSSVVTIPRRASSAPARRVSAIAVASGWSTKANRVNDWSRSAASARSYLTFASAIAAAGPMHVWPEPAADSAMLFDQASGSSSRRTVWPVGAVSKITRSNDSPPAGGAAGAVGSRKSAKRSNAATSAVHGPASCSSMTRTISGGKISRIGASVRSVYSAVARSGSISIAHRFGTPAIGVIAWPIGCSNTSARLEAGSVVTIRTRVPASASATAVVQAIVVLPTPPLPEKKRNWVTGGSFR